MHKEDVMAEKTMNADMSNGQIEDLVNKMRDAARTHRDEIPRDVMQQVLGLPNIGVRIFAFVRSIAEDLSKQVVHVPTVDRKRWPKATLRASGRKLYVIDSVVDNMPPGAGKRVKLVYFKPDPSSYKDGWLSCDALAEEYKKRGLVSDPQAQIDDNAANPEFADTTPNACQWVDADGNYCCASFLRWLGERRVSVYRGGSGWDGSWSFAGVPQDS